MLSVDFINKNIITTITNEDISKNVKLYYEKEYLNHHKHIYENLINFSVEKAILNKKNITTHINYDYLNDIYIKNIRDFLKPNDNYTSIKKYICYNFIKKYVDKIDDNIVNILYIHVFNIDDKIRVFEINLNEIKDEFEFKLNNLEHKIKDNKYNFDDKIKLIEDNINYHKLNFDLILNQIQNTFNKILILIGLLNFIILIFIINKKMS